MWCCVCNRHICNMITAGNNSWGLLNVTGFALSCIHSWRKYKFQLEICETQSKTMIFLVLVSYIPLALTLEVPGHRAKALSAGLIPPPVRWSIWQSSALSQDLMFLFCTICRGEQFMGRPSLASVEGSAYSSSLSLLCPAQLQRCGYEWILSY